MITIYDVAEAPAEQYLEHSTMLRSQGQRTRNLTESIRPTAEWNGGGDWSGLAAEAATKRIRTSNSIVDIAGVTSEAAGIATDVHGNLLKMCKAVTRPVLEMVEKGPFDVTETGIVTIDSAVELVLIVGSKVPQTALASKAAHTALKIAATAMTATLVGALTAAEGADTAATIALSQLAITKTLSLPAPGGSVAVEAPEVTTKTLNTQHGPIVEVGKVKEADRIITAVSGVGSDSDDSVAKSTDWAKRQVAEAAAKGEKVAVVAWHAYDAPDNLGEGISGKPAEKAAPALKAFQDDLRRRNPDARLEVQGYSYGSVVVGDASQLDGFQSDANHYWGSPGTQPSDIPTTARRIPGDPIVAAPDGPRELFGFNHGPDPVQNTLWDFLMDSYLWIRGDGNTHSNYWYDSTATPPRR